MNVGLNCKTYRFKQHSEVLLNWSKTVFVNIVYKLFKRLFTYTRLNSKLGFGKTSFVNTAINVQDIIKEKTKETSSNISWTCIPSTTICFCEYGLIII